MTETSKILLTLLVSERDHAQGLATAAVTLVEYGDYNDPRCAAAQPWIKDLQARMGDNLRLIFRQFPASSFHMRAAEAAEVAGLQGQFWEMHDTLFAHQSALENGHIVEYARDLGLDISRFLRDMTGHVSVERVCLDLASGAQNDVQDTPTFFVNGTRQPSSWKGDLAALSDISAKGTTSDGRHTEVSGAEQSDKHDSDEQSHIC